MGRFGEVDPHLKTPPHIHVRTMLLKKVRYPVRPAYLVVDISRTVPCVLGAKGGTQADEPQMCSQVCGQGGDVAPPISSRGQVCSQTKLWQPEYI